VVATRVDDILIRARAHHSNVLDASAPASPLPHD
jgi:hypothetical protein